MGDAIPETFGLYQEYNSNRIICYKHAQGKMVRHIAKRVGTEQCWYCLNSKEPMPA